MEHVNEDDVQVKGSKKTLTDRIRITHKSKDFTLAKDAGAVAMEEWIRKFATLMAASPDGERLAAVLLTATGDVQRSHTANDLASEYSVKKTSKKLTRSAAPSRLNEGLQTFIENVMAGDTGTDAQLQLLQQRLAAVSDFIQALRDEASTQTRGATPEVTEAERETTHDGTEQTGEATDATEETPSVATGGPLPFYMAYDTACSLTASNEEDITGALRYKDLTEADLQVDREFYASTFTAIELHHPGVQHIKATLHEQGIQSTLAVLLEAQKHFGQRPLVRQATALRTMQGLRASDELLQSKLEKSITDLYKLDVDKKATIMVTLYHLFKPGDRRHEILKQFELTYPNFTESQVLQLLRGNPTSSPPQPGLFHLEEEQLYGVLRSGTPRKKINAFDTVSREDAKASGACFKCGKLGHRMNDIDDQGRPACFKMRQKNQYQNKKGKFDQGKANFKGGNGNSKGRYDNNRSGGTTYQRKGHEKITSSKHTVSLVDRIRAATGRANVNMVRANINQLPTTTPINTEEDEIPSTYVKGNNIQTPTPSQDGVQDEDKDSDKGTSSVGMSMQDILKRLEEVGARSATAATSVGCVAVNAAGLPAQRRKSKTKPLQGYKHVEERDMRALEKHHLTSIPVSKIDGTENQKVRSLLTTAVTKADHLMVAIANLCDELRVSPAELLGASTYIGKETKLDDPNGWNINLDSGAAVSVLPAEMAEKANVNKDEAIELIAFQGKAEKTAGTAWMALVTTDMSTGKSVRLKPIGFNIHKPATVSLLSMHDAVNVYGWSVMATKGDIEVRSRTGKEIPASWVGGRLMLQAQVDTLSQSEEARAGKDPVNSITATVQQVDACIHTTATDTTHDECILEEERKVLPGDDWGTIAEAEDAKKAQAAEQRDTGTSLGIGKEYSCSTDGDGPPTSTGQLSCSIQGTGEYGSLTAEWGVELAPDEEAQILGHVPTTESRHTMGITGRQYSEGGVTASTRTLTGPRLVITFPRCKCKCNTNTTAHDASTQNLRISPLFDTQRSAKWDHTLQWDENGPSSSTATGCTTEQLTSDHRESESDTSTASRASSAPSDFMPELQQEQQASDSAGSARGEQTPSPTPEEPEHKRRKLEQSGKAYSGSVDGDGAAKDPGSTHRLAVPAHKTLKADHAETWLNDGVNNKEFTLTQKRPGTLKKVEEWSVKTLHGLTHSSVKRMRATVTATYGVKVDFTDSTWRNCKPCMIAKRSAMKTTARTKSTVRQGVTATVRIGSNDEETDAGMKREVEFDHLFNQSLRTTFNWMSDVNIPMIAARGHSTRITDISDHYAFGSLFIDNKEITIPGQYARKQEWLVICDLYSTCVWVYTLTSKANNVTAWRRFIADYQLHRSVLPITCYHDNCGSMTPVRAHNHKVGINDIMIPPGMANHPGELAVAKAIQGATLAFLQGEIPIKYFTLLGDAAMMLDSHMSCTAEGRHNKPAVEIITGYISHLPHMVAPGTICFCRPLPGEKNHPDLAPNKNDNRYQKALLAKLIDWPDRRQPTLYRVLVYATQRLRMTNQVVFLRDVYSIDGYDFGNQLSELETTVNQLLPEDPGEEFNGTVTIDLPEHDDLLDVVAQHTQGGSVSDPTKPNERHVNTDINDATGSDTSATDTLNSDDAVTTTGSSVSDEPNKRQTRSSTQPSTTLAHTAESSDSSEEEEEEEAADQPSQRQQRLQNRRRIRRKLQKLQEKKQNTSGLLRQHKTWEPNGVTHEWTYDKVVLRGPDEIEILSGSDLYEESEESAPSADEEEDYTLNAVQSTNKFTNKTTLQSKQSPPVPDPSTWPRCACQACGPGQTGCPNKIVPRDYDRGVRYCDFCEPDGQCMERDRGFTSTTYRMAGTGIRTKHRDSLQASNGSRATEYTALQPRTLAPVSTPEATPFGGNGPAALQEGGRWSRLTPVTCSGSCSGEVLTEVKTKRARTETERLTQSSTQVSKHKGSANQAQTQIQTTRKIDGQCQQPSPEATIVPLTRNSAHLHLLSRHGKGCKRTEGQFEVDSLTENLHDKVYAMSTFDVHYVHIGCTSGTTTQTEEDNEVVINNTSNFYEEETEEEMAESNYSTSTEEIDYLDHLAPDKGKDLRYLVNIAATTAGSMEQTGSDLSYKLFLDNPDTRQRVITSVEDEFDSLIGKGCLKPMSKEDPDWQECLHNAVGGRCILDIKKSGKFKTRMVKQGIPGTEPPTPGRDSYTNLARTEDVRLQLSQSDDRYEDRVTVIIDIANAYAQGDPWKQSETKRFIRVKHPVTLQVIYFQELIPIYGGMYAGNNWEMTAFKHLKAIGMEQGINSQSMFTVGHHDDLHDPVSAQAVEMENTTRPSRQQQRLTTRTNKKVTRNGAAMLSYVDDSIIDGNRQTVKEIVRLLRQRFKIKRVQELEQGQPLDFLGMQIYKGRGPALHLDGELH